MNTDEEPQEVVSPEPIEDYSVFKEGDIFPPLNKKIHILILSEHDYIVFLDKDLYVHWYYNSNYVEDEFAEDYGAIVSREANLEATSALLLKKQEPQLEKQGTQLEVFRRLLGESIARLLDDRWSKEKKKPNNARMMLDKAELFLRERSRERARIWYLSATLGAAMLMLIGVLVLWINRQKVLTLLSVEESFIEVMLGVAMGSLGALISVLLRSDDLKIDVSAGARVHYFEGAMRVLVGATAGLVFALSIKSNILLGAINNSERATTILLVISIIAGVSERLLPSLIKQLEGTLVGQIAEVKITTKDGQEVKAEGGEDNVIDDQDDVLVRRRKKSSS
jgi:hypothetical protein